MCTRKTLIKLMLLILLLPTLAAAQRVPVRGAFIPLSTYRDDPFAATSVIESLESAKFGQAENGQPTPDHPQGERRNVIVPSLPPNQRMPYAVDLPE